MHILRIIIPVLLGTLIGISFGWKGTWGIGTYQSWLFPVAYFLGLLIMGCIVRQP